MATYWVDPYINSVSGGIHGTLNGTTRNGSYSYPWSMDDILTTLDNTTFNGTTIAAGDEIRLKGLPLSTYQIDVGSNWYYSNYYIIRATSANANFQSEHSTYNYTSYCFMYDKTYTDNFTVADSSGNKPLIIQPFRRSNDTYLYTYPRDPANGYIESIVRQESPNSSNTNTQLYLIDPQYYINSSLSSSTYYFATRISTDYTVTDGWTSETVRNGYTILHFNSTNLSSTKYFNFNHNGSGDVVFDLPSTYFSAMQSNNYYGFIRYYLYPALGNNNTVTQKFGGFYNTGYAGYLYNEIGNYYTGSQYTDTSTNNCEINYLAVYYPYTYNRYGSSNTYTRYNNSSISVNLYFFNLGYRDIYLGSIFSYISSYLISISESTKNYTIHFLNNSNLGSSYSGSYLFSLTPANVSIGTNVKNSTENTYFYSGGPLFGSSTSTFNQNYSPNVPLTASSWINSTGLFFDGRTSSSYMSEANIALGILQCSGSDYKSTDTNILIKTDMYVYRSSSYQANVNFHFSTNDYDDIPIGLCLSEDRNFVFHYPMIYYNDANKNDALCFQSNGEGNVGDDYIKRIQIEIPDYTTENITFTANIETSSDWDQNITILIEYINFSGTVLTSTLVSTSSSSVSPSTNYTTTISNANLPSTDKLKHVNAVIEVNNGSVNTKKVWIHNISAALS